MKVLSGWCESQLLQDKVRARVAGGKRWQRRFCPVKFRNSCVCRWWIYEENQSQTDCREFYFHLNCLPTG